MIIKLDLKIEIAPLISYLDFVNSTCPPNMKIGGPWGGWSITSSNGEIHDGWQAGEKINNPGTFPEEGKKLSDFFATTEFNKPTAIYNDFIKDLVDTLKSSLPNITLSRLRIAILKPHPESEGYWHKDGEAKDGQKFFRLHIPIITNEKCYFEYPEERHHLKADGSVYFVEISRMHRALNLSSENRYHLIADTIQNLSE